VSRTAITKFLFFVLIVAESILSADRLVPPDGWPTFIEEESEWV
jgi:hypothetical protein